MGYFITNFLPSNYYERPSGIESVIKVDVRRVGVDTVTFKNGAKRYGSGCLQGAQIP